MLTRKQRELLQFLSEREVSNRGAPSFDEMKEALGLKSKSGIHRLVIGLEERGFIRRLAHRARAIEVIRGHSWAEDREVLCRRIADADDLLRAIWQIDATIISKAQVAVAAARRGGRDDDPA